MTDSPTPDRDELVRDANDLLKHAKAYAYYAEIADSAEEQQAALFVAWHLSNAAEQIHNAMRVADNSDLTL